MKVTSPSDIPENIRELFPYAVYSGSEKFEYGDKSISALCQSETQAEILSKEMWPDSGYWELMESLYA